MQSRIRLATGTIAALAAAFVIYFVCASSAPRPRPSFAARPANPSANSAKTTETDDNPYVGLDACAECHPAQYRSYRQTAHSLALAEINPVAEPVDGEFVHSKSGRSYQVYRHEGELRHREWLTDDEDGVVADYPVRYVIGSGIHTRSYLVEDDGFLMESPITWYASRQAWGLSPGYDHPDHWGFERAADLGCITCHVGRAEATHGSLNRILIHEEAIGCERCHGPGRNHVVERKNHAAAAIAKGTTIVNPATLPRELQEAVCAQCHLRAEATVFLTGRSAHNFRPGETLTDYRVDYQYARPPRQMKVVGHVEQMRLSRCYQASDKLTCTTCHNLHAVPAAAEKADYYRAKCLACHAEDSCGTPLEQRRAESEGDSCVNCHMPQGATDIPHVAFTHHFIGRHKDVPHQEPSGEIAELTPMGDISRLSEHERQRALGLACLEVAETAPDAKSQRFYRLKALRLLSALHQTGVADAEIDAVLARLYWNRSPAKAVEFANAALQNSVLLPRARVNVLFVLGDTFFHGRDWPAAERALRELLTLRRHSEDWRLLGLCQAEMGDLNGAAESLEHALHINPFRAEIHTELARVFAASGQALSATRQQVLAQTLKDSVADRNRATDSDTSK